MFNFFITVPWGSLTAFLHATKLAYLLRGHRTTLALSKALEGKVRIVGACELGDTMAKVFEKATDDAVTSLCGWIEPPFFDSSA